MDLLATTPRCFNHTQETGEACVRCGTFFCPACMQRPGLCFQCHARQKPSALAVASAVIGGLSFCGFFPGVLAIALASVELHRIAKGKSPEQGADWARAGRTLGAVSLLLGALVWLVWPRTR